MHDEVTSWPDPKTNTEPGLRAAHPVLATKRHPLGPLLAWVQPRSSRTTRLTAATIALGCVTLLTVAARLEPDPRGYGTHTQLGQAECGFLLMTQLPCPTCGMTTAFAHAVRGQFVRSFFAQPMGLLLALITAGGVVVSLVAMVGGRVITLNWYRVSATRFVFIVFALFLIGWALRILFHLRTWAPLT